MRVLSLFSGYGGLDLAVKTVFPEARTVYVSDIEEGPCRVLAHRFPDAVNLGDVTAVDWDSLDPVDAIIGGSPCQDLSVAGRRAGMKPGTRSGLWESMTQAIKTMRPRLVVWENVRGALSAPAYSLMESDPRRMGGGAGGVVLRALGRVLGDLTNLGYDCQWSTFRASTIGAPHRRERIFVIAVPSSQGWRLPWHTATRETACRWAPALDSGCSGEPVSLLPTPTVGDKGGECARSVDTRRRTPPLRTRATMTGFGDYAPAITRWEQVIGRPAPSPTIPSPAGKPRLSHHFTEWMMGLPEGWICDPALWVDYPPTKARNACLRMAGNGVVPLQAAWAIHALLDRATRSADGIGL